MDNPDGWEKELSLRALYDYFRGTNRLPDFRTLMEKQPTLSTDALKIFGELYQSEGQMNQAVETYERALKRVPDDVETRLGLAKLYATEKNYKAARTEVGQVLKLEPQNLKARRLQAELEAVKDADGVQKRFAQVGDKDEAVERHYLIKLEERLLASEKTLLPTVREAQEILKESFGES